MINWFKNLDVYGWFLFIVFGVPAIVVVFTGLGVAGIAIIKNHGWATIPIMLTYPTMVLGLTIGIMGAMTDTTVPLYPRQWSAAKKFCVFWWSTTALAVVALGVPGLIVFGIMGALA